MTVYREKTSEPPMAFVIDSDLTIVAMNDVSKRRKECNENEKIGAFLQCLNTIRHRCGQSRRCAYCRVNKAIKTAVNERKSLKQRVSMTFDSGPADLIVTSIPNSENTCLLMVEDITAGKYSNLRLLP